MIVTLVPMGAERYLTWTRQQIADYARDKVAAGSWPESESEALDRAATEQAALLPDGPQTSDHHLFVAEADGDEVGNLWLFTGGDTREAFIYNIEIVEAQRGRGLGRALLRSAERWCAERDLAALRLNVFSFNTVAISLYESEGFVPTNMNMVKAITS